MIGPFARWVCCALEQERQSCLGVRRLVLESVSKTAPFEFHGGGYATLSFIPTLATMILGLLAGGILASGMLRASRSYGTRLSWLVMLGCIMLSAGWALDHFGICPNVKRSGRPLLFSSVEEFAFCGSLRFTRSAIGGSCEHGHFPLWLSDPTR